MKCQWSSEQRLRNREAPLPVEAVAQTLAFDERHDEVQRTIRVTRVVQGEDVWMAQRRRGGHLAQEPFSANGVRQLRA